MAEIWTPSEGETVQVVAQDSNDFGKIGRVTFIHREDQSTRPYGVTFGDSVLRYFSRDGLTWVSSPTTRPAPDPVPADQATDPPVFRLETFGQYADCEAQLTISGRLADLLPIVQALAVPRV